MHQTPEWTMSASCDVGIIGGSGLYSLLEDAESVSVSTAYGDPSDAVAVGKLHGRRVAFLPRHGRHHQLAPHAINYRANISALHGLGVRRVLAPCAVGSLRRDRPPGDVVICDQFIDRTHGRADTFFDAGQVAHVSSADPYCPEVAPLAVAAARAAGMNAWLGGTVVVVQGPRFGTRAESRAYAASGWDVVNMTQYPEVILARELGMCYTAIAVVTDFDAGLDGDAQAQPVSQTAVMRVFTERIEALRRALGILVGELPDTRGCGCEHLQAVPLTS